MTLSPKRSTLSVAPLCNTGVMAFLRKPTPSTLNLPQSRGVAESAEEGILFIKSKYAPHDTIS